MKQYRITTENITPASNEDCVLPDDDPVQELIISQYLGGLGSEYRISEYRAKQSIKKSNINTSKGKS